MSPKQKPNAKIEKEFEVPTPIAKRDDGRLLGGGRDWVAWVNGLNGWQYAIVCILVIIVIGLISGGDYYEYPVPAS